LNRHYVASSEDFYQSPHISIKTTNKTNISSLAVYFLVNWTPLEAYMRMVLLHDKWQTVLIKS